MNDNRKLTPPKKRELHPLRVGIMRDYPLIQEEDEELEYMVRYLEQEGIKPEIVFDIRYPPGLSEPVPDLLIIDYGGMSSMGAHDTALFNVKETLKWMDDHPGKLIIIWTMFTEYLFAEAIEEMEIKERNNVILIGKLKADELDEAWSKVRLWFGIEKPLEE